MENEQWVPAGIRHGFYQDVEVSANRYVGKKGEVAWNVRVYPPKQTQPGRYFIVGDQFYECQGTHMVPGGTGQIVTGPKVVMVDQLQRTAVMKLISQWKEPEADQAP